MAHSLLLFVHICGGTLGLLSGAVAMSFRKGSRGHRTAGGVFFISMLCMASTGTFMAVVNSEFSNVLGGVLVMYMVATAWATVRRTEGRTGIFDLVACLFVCAVATAMLTWGVQAAAGPSGTKNGLPAAMYFVFGSIATIAALGDIRMLARGGILGVNRIARHLWRMCFALFAASASIFLARPRLFPAALSRIHVLQVLGILPLLLLIFWLCRVYLSNRAPRPSGTPVTIGF